MSPKPTDPFSEIPIAPPSVHGAARKPDHELASPFHPVFPRQTLPPKKSSAASTFLAILGLGVFVYWICGYFAVPILIKTVGTRTLARHLDRPVTIGLVEFNPFTLTLTLANGIIGPRLSDPTDKVDPIISFSSLTLDLDALSLPRRAIICQELSISQPFLHLVRNQEHGYNISLLLPASDHASPSKQSRNVWLAALIPPRYSINNISISRGEILYEDLPTAKIHHLEELNFSLPAIANINYQNGQIKPQFSAIVNGTPLQMSGQAQMAEGPMTASLSCKMNNLDLTAYKDYLSPNLGIQTLSGQADLDLNLLYAAAAPQTERLRLAGAMTLRAAKLSGEQGEFSVDSGLIKGSFSPATSLFQAEEINLRHPVWQRSSGHASLFDSLRLPAATPEASASGKPWPAAIGAIFLPDPKQGSTLPLNHLQITSGEIREPSRTDAEPPSDWQAIDVSINTAQSTGGQDGQQQVLFTLNAKKQTGSRVTIQGSASTAPFEAKGLLVVNHTDIDTLQGLWQRFGAALPVKSGVIEQVQANFSITIDPDQRPQFLLDPLSIQAKNLRIERSGQLLEIPVWQSEQGSFTTSDPTLHLGKVQLQQALFTCRRESRTAAWQSFLNSPAEPPPQVAHIDLNALELTNTSLLIENQGPPDISMRLERLDLQVDHFDPQKANTISASAMLRDRYPIQANGTFSLSPFQASLNIQASDLPLSTFQPILDRYFAGPINGTLSAEGVLNLPSLDYQGKWSIDSLSAPPISCRSLSAEGAALILRPLKLTIDQLSVKEPSLQVTANPNGMPQLPAIMQPGWQPASSAQEATVTIKTIDIEDGSLIYDLPDSSVPSSDTPRGGMTLSGKRIAGSIDEFVVAKDQAIPFTLKGLLETRAEFQAQGVIRPFASPPGLELKSQITGLPLIALGTILEPYWGFTVRGGTLDFTNQLTYADTLIQDSSRLSLHDLSFGKPLAPPAIKAIGDTWQSLPFVQAMLQDANETIELTVPIDGRTDTGFTYQTAMKAFLNQLLLKATVSPMNLLSNSQKAPSDIVLFQPGDSQLAAAAVDQLKALAALLLDRPLLVVRLAGFADSAADSQALLNPKKKALPQESAKGQAPVTDKNLLNLANKRAQAAQKILTNQGIPLKQIRVAAPELIGADNAGHSGCRVAISFNQRE